MKKKLDLFNESDKVDDNQLTSITGGHGYGCMTWWDHDGDSTSSDNGKSESFDNGDSTMRDRGDSTSHDLGDSGGVSTDID
ncbi:MAG: hypothetical protein AAGA77_22380 [Bacteroidota bacterium]